MTYEMEITINHEFEILYHSFDNLKDISKQSLREQIGIVPQDIILFNDTVKNNISYGFQDVNINDIKDAARAANALEFIEQLPDGFDTIIGEKGARLSGGQKQRLSIARAIFKNPKILIMDEATSSLDAESEEKVQNAIFNLTKNRTTIVIAHRLSTIKKANRIIVMKDGSIVGEGTHEELLKNSKVYENLYKKQVY